MSAHNYNDVDLSFEEQKDLERQHSLRKFQDKMMKLFKLRQRVGNRANPSMPRLDFDAHLLNPDIIDCYIRIEQWKADGGETDDFDSFLNRNMYSVLR